MSPKKFLNLTNGFIKKNINITHNDFLSFKKIVKKLKLNISNIPIITIAGTNGKGTTINLIYRFLLYYQYKVGMFISPCIFKINEQIVVDSYHPSDIDLINIIEYIKTDLKKINSNVTYFEFIFLITLKFFKLKKPNIILLEVGLGGLFDATNILNPIISVITTIDFDHQEILGNTRNKIGLMKAGIFRTNSIGICGDPKPPKSVILYAKKLNMPLLIQNKDFNFKENFFYWYWNSKKNFFNKLPIPNIPLQNASTALMVLEILQEFYNINILSHNVLIKILKNFNVIGRMQILNFYDKKIILDVAHNIQSTKYLKYFIQKKFYDKKIICLFSSLKDKKYKEMIRILDSLQAEWHFTFLQNEKRAASIKDMQSALFKKSFQHKSVISACQYLIYSLKSNDLLIIFGSFRVIKESLLFFKKIDI